MVVGDPGLELTPPPGVGDELLVLTTAYVDAVCLFCFGCHLRPVSSNARIAALIFTSAPAFLLMSLRLRSRASNISLGTRTSIFLSTG